MPVTSLPYVEQWEWAKKSPDCYKDGVGLQVLVLSVPVEPPLFVEPKGRVVRLGRAEDADVRLPDPTVSAYHATLKKRGQSYLLTDEGSRNGTALLGLAEDRPVWLEPGSPRVVASGFRLRLGQVELELRTDGSAEGLPSEDLARDLITASFATLQLDVSEQRINEALHELTDSEDEPIAKPVPQVDSPPNPSSDDGGVLSEDSDRFLADWAIALLALLLLGVSAAALSWLLG